MIDELCVVALANNISLVDLDYLTIPQLQKIVQIKTEQSWLQVGMICSTFYKVMTGKTVDPQKFVPTKMGQLTEEEKARYKMPEKRINRLLGVTSGNC